MQDIASLALKIDASEVNAGTKALGQLTQQGGQAEAMTVRLAQASRTLGDYAKYAAGAFGLYKLADYARDATLLSARYETLGISMYQAGKNAGYTRGEMDSYQKALERTGISMVEARNTMIQMTTSNMDLANATKLARAAQDLAVVGNTNSSEAFNKLVYGIKSAQTEILRTLGINVSFEDSYKKLANELHKNSNALTESEKLQARTNATMEAAAKYQGIYEQAMGTAGKQLTSLTRYQENFKLIVGETFNEGLAFGVGAFTESLKDATKEAQGLSESGNLKEWGRATVLVLAVVADSARMVFNTLGAMATMVERLAVTAAILNHPFADNSARRAQQAELKKQQEEFQAGMVDNLKVYNSVVAGFAKADETKLEAARRSAKEQTEVPKAAAAAYLAYGEDVKNAEKAYIMVMEGSTLEWKGRGKVVEDTSVSLGAHSNEIKTFITALNAETAAIGKNAYQKQYLDVITKTSLTTRAKEREEIMASFRAWSLATQAEEERVAALQRADFNPEADFWDEVNSARAKNARAAQAKLDEENKRMSEQLTDHITEGLMRGFESGKGFAQNLVDTTKNIFKSMVLEPQIKAAVNAAIEFVAFKDTALVTNTAALQANTAALSGATIGGPAAATPLAGGGALAIAGYAAAAYVVAQYGLGMGNSPERVGGPRLVGTVSRSGVSGGLEQDWMTRGGWLTTDSRSTERIPITKAQGEEYQSTINSYTATLIRLGTAIGATDVRTKNWSFSVNKAGDINRIITDGMTRELIPALELFRKEGESMVQTATRLTSIFETTNDLLAALGMSSLEAFGAYGVMSTDQRELLIEASGGLDAFARNAAAFVRSILSPTQQLAISYEQVARVFAELNVVGVETKEQFAALVASQLALGNYDVVASLMSVSDAFATITDSAEAARRSMVDINTFETMVDYKRAMALAASGAMMPSAATIGGIAIPTLPAPTIPSSITGATQAIEPVLNEEELAQESAARALLKQQALDAYEAYKLQEPEYDPPEGYASRIRYDDEIFPQLISDWQAQLAALWAYYESLPSFATGIGSVPRDMLAKIHEGEAVLNVPDAQAYRQGNNSDEIVAELRALRAEMAAIRSSADATANNSRKTSDLLRNVSRDGQSLLTEAA